MKCIRYLCDSKLTWSCVLVTTQISRRCKQQSETSQVAELLALSVDQKLELGKAVLKAVLQKEDGLRAAMGTGGDYGKSFSGTKQDTQASIIRCLQDRGGNVSVVPAVVCCPQMLACTDDER